MADHYETLGVARGADAPTIRRAFSKLAKELHPDKNPDPKATETFMRVKEAYDTLSDPARRESYDAVLRFNDELSKRARAEEEAQREAERERAAAEAQSTTRRSGETVGKEAFLQLKELKEQLEKRINLNRLADAESTADQILNLDPRSAVAYAAKGDIFRIRGDLTNAQKMYAYAVQFDSRNPVYQRKYEETMTGAERAATKSPLANPERPAAPAMVATFVVLVGAAYTVLAKEPPLFKEAALASSLTLGQLVMFLVAGLTLGACLVASDVLDPIETTMGTAVAKVPPALVLAVVAVVNYWLATVLYTLVGMTQNALNGSLSRVIGYSGLVTAVFALAKLPMGGMAFGQTLLWGGNLVYLGAAFGWYTADSLRSLPKA